MRRFFKSLSKNHRDMQRIRPDEPLAIIGDVHGRADLLDGLLTQIAEQAADARIVFVGDLIDRGPDSRRVLTRARTSTGAVIVMGNHERMLLDVFDAIANDDYATCTRTAQRWINAGGDTVLAEYGLQLDNDNYHDVMTGLRQALDAGTEDWLRALPPIWHSGNVAVAHAGANPRESVDQQNPDHCIWGHAAFGKYPRKDGFWVVHGHNIVSQPTLRNDIISVDTGAYRGGRLTAALIGHGQVRFLSV